MLLFRIAFRIFRRFAWLVIGFLLGWASSLALTRRVRRVTQRYAPVEMRERFRDMRAAVDEGRGAMRAREAELKGSIGRNGGK